MSIVGPTTPAAVLAGAIAGAQRNNADTDRNKSEAAGRKFEADLKALSAGVLGDVGQTDQTGDRDADGRLPWVIPQLTAHKDDAPRRPPRLFPPDAWGERGNTVDLEA